MASAVQAKAVCASGAQTTRRTQQRVAASAFVAGAPVQRKQGFLGRAIVQSASRQQQQSRSAALKVFAIRDGATLDRPLRVAVIGGGPSGACAAESLAKGGCEAFLIERKMDNCKVSKYCPAAAASPPAYLPGPSAAALRAGCTWNSASRT